MHLVADTQVVGYVAEQTRFWQFLNAYYTHLCARQTRVQSDINEKKKPLKFMDIFVVSWNSGCTLSVRLVLMRFKNIVLNSFLLNSFVTLSVAVYCNCSDSMGWWNAHGTIASIVDEFKCEWNTNVLLWLITWEAIFEYSADSSMHTDRLQCMKVRVWGRRKADICSGHINTRMSSPTSALMRTHLTSNSWFLALTQLKRA